MASQADLDAAVSAAEAAVAAETTVDDSAGTLLAQLNQLYKDALAQGGPPQAIVDRITALTNSLSVSAPKLQAAVTDNTPQANP